MTGSFFSEIEDLLIDGHVESALAKMKDFVSAMMSQDPRAYPTGLRLRGQLVVLMGRVVRIKLDEDTDEDQSIKYAKVSKRAYAVLSATSKWADSLKQRSPIREVADSKPHEADQTSDPQGQPDGLSGPHLADGLVRKPDTSDLVAFEENESTHGRAWAASELPHSSVEALVNVLTRLASVDRSGPALYLRNLVLRSDLPSSAKNRWAHSFGTNPEYDARDLVNGLLKLGTNPKDKNNALGTVLLALLPELFVEDAALVTITLLNHGLLNSLRNLTDLQLRFQVPMTAVSSNVGGYGPSFDWHGPADETTLQGWLRPMPDFLDVAFLLDAMKQARCVCRVEVGATGESGTGVLVGHDVVLTNHHVISRDGRLLETNARTAVLRFGAFTNADRAPDGGQLVSVADAEPVLVSSPIEEHDFVLLRVGGEIAQAKDIAVAKVGNWNPKLRSAIHILQHPHGGSMKLAMSDDGVTSVDLVMGKVQYVTRAAGGSSGSPCFDANWNVVALHRAERASSFGAMREGILLSAIYPRIERFLR